MVMYPKTWVTCMAYTLQLYPSDCMFNSVIPKNRSAVQGALNDN